MSWKAKVEMLTTKKPKMMGGRWYLGEYIRAFALYTFTMMFMQWHSAK